jgi:hypothetical protein
MTVSRRRRRAAPALSTFDHGPRIGGALRPEVAVMERADPDNPNRTVRGARRRSGYDWLHARGVISDAQREAADRYCTAHERASGASERRRAIIARVPPWMQGHPTMEQLAAVGDIGLAQAVIGTKVNRLVLDAITLEGRTLESLSAQLSEPVPGVIGRLRAVLDIMAEQWGID